MKRRIAVVTATRAEWGLLRGVAAAVRAHPRLTLSLVVAGQHLDRAYGRTIRELEADGFAADARVPLPLRDDSSVGVADAMASGVRGFARAFARLRPDIVLLLGDRCEVLAAAAAAMALRVPIAHVHGGESTEGLIDEQVRHAVTKLAHLHFTAAEPFRRRLIRMGEDPRRVLCTGAPGLDGISRAGRIPRRELLASLGLPPSLGRYGLVTYHPVTLSPGTAGKDARELVAALDAVDGVFWVITLPNAEAERDAVVSVMRRYAAARPGRARAVTSLGRERYLALLRGAAVMVGNSSSGLLEAPSFGLPAVNIGLRQAGRLRAANVIDVPRCERRAVAAAIRRAFSPALRRRLAGLPNPYAGRDACGRIAAALAAAPSRSALLHKSFGGGA